MIFYNLVGSFLFWGGFGFYVELFSEGRQGTEVLAGSGDGEVVFAGREVVGKLEDF
jgi:hypothetical protein